MIVEQTLVFPITAQTSIIYFSSIDRPEEAVRFRPVSVCGSEIVLETSLTPISIPIFEIAS